MIVLLNHFVAVIHPDDQRLFGVKVVVLQEHLSYKLRDEGFRVKAESSKK